MPPARTPPNTSPPNSPPSQHPPPLPRRPFAEPVDITQLSCRNARNANVYFAALLQDPNGAVTIRTRKFLTNRLLQRKQVSWIVPSQTHQLLG